MLSIKDLYNITNKYEPDSSNAKFVRVINAQKISPNFYRFVTFTNIPSNTKNYPKGHTKRHTCIIGDLGKKEFSDINSNIFLSCNCERFKYK